MAPLSKVVTILLLLLLTMALFFINPIVEATWCVARSDASDQALQTSLDYACGSGADCAPVQPSGLCYLPNTVQAHASYAFDSYFQRKGMAPGSCDFSGTATVARTDPSYGSCVYPSSTSTAGGSITPGGTARPSNAPPPPGSTTPLYGSGGLTPGFGPVLPNTPNSKASREFSIANILFLLSLLLVLSFILQPI